MLIKKLHEMAIVPKYATTGSAGLDLHAVAITGLIEVPPTNVAVLVPTGLSMEIPVGVAGFIYPRSGLGHKNGIVLGNGTGVIDSDYRGQIFVSILNRGDETFFIQHGDRIAQMVFMPVIQFEIKVTDELENTVRGAGGFGSTGAK